MSLSSKAPQSAQPLIIDKLKRKAKSDLVWGGILVFGITATSWFLNVDIVETIYVVTRHHEPWELDEILTGLFWLGLFSIMYVVRRMNDIKTLNKEIVKNAYFDPITNLPNRVLALDRLEQQLYHAKRYDEEVVVAFLDFDNFKVINDTYGHNVGDKLIHLVGKRLARVIRCNETVARLGGDEFLILATFNKNSFKNIPRLMSRIQNTHHKPFIIDTHVINITYSVGVSIYPQDGITSVELIKQADKAMYAVKNKRKRACNLYPNDIECQLIKHDNLAVCLEKAIENNDLYLLYQPIVNFSNHAIVGYEALLRWHKNNDFVDPQTLISVAEQAGIIDEIGNWILRRACADARQYLQPEFPMAINISVQQLMNENFASNLETILTEHELSPDRIELEMTESILNASSPQVLSQIEKVRALGVTISIDHFNIDLSCFHQLKALNINKIKVDRSLLDDLEDENIHLSTIKTLVTLSNRLGLQIVAEKVETEAQAIQLDSLKCKTMQGYYFSKPISAKEINSFVP